MVEGLELTIREHLPEFLLVDTDDLVASQQFDPSDVPIGVFDTANVTLVWTLDDRHRQANMSIPRTPAHGS